MPAFSMAFNCSGNIYHTAQKQKSFLPLIVIKKAKNPGCKPKLLDRFSCLKMKNPQIQVMKYKKTPRPKNRV